MSLKNKKINKLKLVDRAKQRLYAAVSRLLSLVMAFVLCSNHSFPVFDLGHVRGKLDLANITWLNFQKQTPQFLL